MKTEQELNSAILEITQTILNKYPELTSTFPDPNAPHHITPLGVESLYVFFLIGVVPADQNHVRANT